MKVIFLDIDEVLNSYLHQMSCVFYNRKTGLKRPLVDEYMVYILAEIIKKTNAKVVLTSSKRGSWNNPSHHPNDHNKLIDDVFIKYGIEIYDITKSLSDRTEDIEEWLSRHPDVTHYLILDDSISDLKKFIGNHLLQIPSDDLYNQGLKPNHIKPAVDILNQTFKK